jgi:hypothetical protein
MPIIVYVAHVHNQLLADCRICSGKMVICCAKFHEPSASRKQKMTTTQPQDNAQQAEPSQKPGSNPRWLLIVVGVTMALVVVVVTTALLVPQQTNPAFATAIDFSNAASRGDDEAARALLNDDLQQYVAQNCPDGSVAACIDAYIPPEWGGFLNAVFRRAQPDGQNAWDVQLVATYAEGQGFSGICIYNRVERIPDETDAPDNWQVVRWAGWVSCDLPNSGLSSLAGDADAPNAAP